jgi:hypothetical protein
MVMVPARKSTGTIRFDFASEKIGYAIRSCASRGSQMAGIVGASTC